MTDPASETNTGRDEPEASESTPTWVKAFAIVGLAFLVLLVFLLVAGGHGPGRHSLAVPAASAAHA